MRIFVARIKTMNIPAIFDITNDAQFEAKALAVFRFQLEHNLIYQEFCSFLGKNATNVRRAIDIPFLPIEFFKSKVVITTKDQPQVVFSSSGTTGNTTSKHYLADTTIYEQSYLSCFKQFYGAIDDYCILALLPSYLERKGSSLIYMVDDLIKKSNHPDSGFYLNDTTSLKNKLVELAHSKQKVLLIGVAFALLDFVEKHSLHFPHLIVMETGGMKGRRKEIIREELHDALTRGFGVKKIHSEYGMTELLSQAYSKGNGIFKTPPWMRVLIRDTEDPFHIQDTGKTGGLNIIDLANIYSCSFIATQDLGKLHKNGSFEILGRFDHSDIRGCNLMIM